MEKIRKYMGTVLACIAISFINEKYHLIITSYNDMVGYQFNIFTISTVLAGFSFTSLGTLLGLSSETLMKKLDDTSIIINKSKKIVDSLLYFCCSGLISLFFIIGLDQLIIRIINKTEIINPNVILNFIFLLGIMFLVLGVVYFIISVYEMYDLIKRVYGANTKKYEEKEKNYKLDIQEAKGRNHEMRENAERDEFTRD